MEPNDNLDYQLYVLAEISYSNACDGKEVDEEDRYPRGWYGCRDYHFKIELIAAALEHDVLLWELPRLGLQEDADPALRELCEKMLRVFG